MMELRDLRENYGRDGLDESMLPENPIDFFKIWMQEAIDSNLKDANAMVLSTIDGQGFVRSRVVLLKDILEGKFVFYTNYVSDKGKEIEKHPSVALNFFWAGLERQIRINGIVAKTSADVSDSYFKARPRGSQIGAWVSPQSEVIADRNVLEQRLAHYEAEFEHVEVVPRPEHWGGYAVTPLNIEFWQGRPNRLHDRVRYVLTDDSWKKERLAP